MKAITLESQAAEAAERWKEVYFERGAWATHPRGCASIHASLVELDLDKPGEALAGEIAAIIGNDTWCKPQNCNECGLPSHCLIQLGDPPDYESRTALICPSCIAAAGRLADVIRGAEAPCKP